METILRLDHPRYEATDQQTHLLVRRLSDADLLLRLVAILPLLHSGRKVTE
ncbi:hypothetical protein SUDANB105_07992 [Streptomyces sp. enrichment culture]